MTNIGRNAPCPCGSGKKYKKCCLPKEQQRSTASRRSASKRRKDETDELFEDLPVAPAVTLDEDEPIEPDAEPRPDLDDEPFVSNTIDNEVPDIDEEAQAIVDDWWTTHKGMEDPDAIIQHLHEFFQAHPKLVVNLGLHHDLLFVLGDSLVKAGRVSDYIELLLRVRRDFPDTYLKSFVYYDRDIIHYKVANGERDEIEGYLNWFKEYPDHDADMLYNLIAFLMATECDRPLIDLLETIYYSVYRSDRVIRGGRPLEPLILSYSAPYLDQGWTPADLNALSERLKAVRVPLNDQLYRPDYLDDLFNGIVGDLDVANFSSFYDSRDIHAFYRKVTLNFMGWLRKEKGFSWMKAQFYQNSVEQYFMVAIPDGKRPKKPFVFSKQLLEDAIGRMARMFFSLDPTLTMGGLNAIYWFADYLLQHQAISERMHTGVQTWCEELWQIVAPQFLETTIEAPVFDTFPQ